MNELEKIKNDLKNILNGKPPKPKNLKEARLRVIQTDPGIDISDFLKDLNEGKILYAIMDLSIEVFKLPDITKLILIMIIEAKNQSKL
jgi:hypothetical protein